jgi:hypothetical protein
MGAARPGSPPTARTAAYTGTTSIDEPGALFEYWWPPHGETSAVAPHRATPRSIANVPSSAIAFTR